MKPYEFSLTGGKLAGPSGILELMDDLGRAMTVDPSMRMLGGGNPAAVPGMQSLIRQRMNELMSDGDALERMLANYDPPQGNPRFIRELAALLQREFGWDIGPQNIACRGSPAIASDSDGTCWINAAFFSIQRPMDECNASADWISRAPRCSLS